MAVNYTQPAPFQLTPKVRFSWIGEAWGLFAKQPGVWIGATLLYLAIGIIAGLLVAGPSGLISSFVDIARESPADRMANPLAIYAIYAMPAYWVTVIATGLVSSFLISGYLRMAMGQLRGERIAVGMLFSGGSVFLRMWGYAILLGICGVIGSYLCLFPGLVVYALFAPGLVLIADGVPFGEAMNRSVNSMKGDWLMGALFTLVYILIYFVGSLVTCFLGFFVFVPMGALILALVYRDMLGMPGVAIDADPYSQQFAGAVQPGVWPPAPSANQAPASYPPPPVAPDNPSQPTGFQLPPVDPYAPPSDPEQNPEK